MADNYLKGPSQQSHYNFNGFPGPAENVSQTNRPHFDQISDVTKYVLNPNNLGQTVPNNRNTQGTGTIDGDKRTIGTALQNQASSVAPDP